MGGNELKNKKPQGWEEKFWSIKKEKAAQTVPVGRS